MEKLHKPLNAESVLSILFLIDVLSHFRAFCFWPCQAWFVLIWNFRDTYYIWPIGISVWKKSIVWKKVALRQKLRQLDCSSAAVIVLSIFFLDWNTCGFFSCANIYCQASIGIAKSFFHVFPGDGKKDSKGEQRGKAGDWWRDVRGILPSAHDGHCVWMVQWLPVLQDLQDDWHLWR